MKKVIEYIKQNKLLQKGDNIILGVSGGADWVCLLYILNDLKKEYSLNITAVHVNHMIRETAGRDEDFTRKLCEGLGISFEAVKTDCPAIAGRDGISVEEAGRNERYRIFAAVGDEKYGRDAYKIAVAHHMDDLAETLVFNMARGTGISGLTGVKAKNGNLIRPLLSVTRAEIEAFLDKRKVSHVEDETNLSDDYARNRIRHRIIPAMNEITEKAVNHMASTATQLGEIEDYLNIKSDELWEKYVEETALPESPSSDKDTDLKSGQADIDINDPAVSDKRTESVEKRAGNCGPCEIFINQDISSEHPALVKRVIHRALTRVAGRARDISTVQIEAVSELLASETSRKRDLIYNMEALREYEGVRIFVKREENADKSEILKRLKIEIKDRDFSQNIPTDLYTKWFDYDKIKNCPNVRFRKDGDYLTIDSRNQKKLLSDYMTNEKIPRAKRDEVPLLADGSHILWVVGHRISNYYKVTDETKKVLIATYAQQG